MSKPLFTKQELADYVKKRGFTADTDSWYDWYVRNEFKYPLGKCLCKLKNWKADVNLKLRTGKFNSKKITESLSKTKAEELAGFWGDK